MPIIRNAFRIGRARTGLGGFASRDLPKNRRIAEYRGPLIPNKVAEKIEAGGNRYLFEINTRWTIDGTPRWNKARYLNHSCNPNAEAAYSDGTRVFIKTLRPIKAGEEITYHYGMDYLRNVIGLSNCKCGRCMRRRAKQKREAYAKKKRAAARKRVTRRALRRKR